MVCILITNLSMLPRQGLSCPDKNKQVKISESPTVHKADY